MLAQCLEAVDSKQIDDLIVENFKTINDDENKINIKKKDNIGYFKKFARKFKSIRPKLTKWIKKIGFGKIKSIIKKGIKWIKDFANTDKMPNLKNNKGKNKIIINFNYFTCK